MPVRTTGCLAKSLRAGINVHSPFSAETQDRDKGVVTLGEYVTGDDDQAQAESIARSFAGNQVLSNQIEVIPPGVESAAKKGELGPRQGWRATWMQLIKARLHKSVSYAVKLRCSRGSLYGAG